MKKATNADEYIAGFPEPTRALLEELRTIIRKAAPEADEVISYGMPAYKQNGMLLYFAGHTNHIGLYPMGSGVEAFAGEIKQYKTSKGTIQFPLDKPLPRALITRIVKFRIQKNREKKQLKSKP